MPYAKESKGKKNTKNKKTALSTSFSSTSLVFCTFHHLLEGKSHKKEQEMVSTAKQMGFKGFIVYGTPGIVAMLMQQGEDANDFMATARKIGKKGDVTLRHPCPEGILGNAGKGLQSIDLARLKTIISEIGADESYRRVLGL